MHLERRALNQALLTSALYAFVVGCGSTNASPPTAVAGSTSGVSGSTASAGAPSAGAPSGGAPSGGASGAAPTTGGEGGSAASGGDTLAAAGDANVGGMSGGGTSSGGASTGAGGASSGAGGQPTSNGGSVNGVASVLDKYQLLDPCDLSTYKIEASSGAVCPQTNAVKNQHITLQFGGDASLTYDVTLHVRGIIEHYWYAGGTLDPVSKTFYTGGVPTVGGFSSACKNKTSELPFTLPAELTPTDNCFNGFNVYALAVSAPKTHYYLNYTTDKVTDRPPHAVYNDDYTVTIPIQGQAKIDFYIIGSDEHECYNHKDVVSGVTLSSSPYIGEFVQFDVTKVSVHQ